MRKVFDYIEKYRMIEPGDKVIVGVSGGADSLCLLFVLRSYQAQVPFELLAVHVEHGIRGEESRADAAYVERLLKEWKIDGVCVPADVPQIAAEKKISLEEAGRQARYEIFEAIRAEKGYHKIAVAHNQNDQAETILFRIARGSGLEGAGGIRPVQGNIIRPLLSSSRKEIEDYLREKKIAWRTDSTNKDTAYTRNFLRNRIFPALEENVNVKSTEHFAELGGELQRVQEYLNFETERFLKEAAVCVPGRAQITVHKFLEAPELLQEYGIRSCLRRSGCGLRDVGRTHIQALKELFEKQSGSRTGLPGGWQARREFDKVIFGREETSRELCRGVHNQGKSCRGTQIQEEFCCEAQIPGACETPEGIFEFRIFENENQNILRKTYTKWFDYDKIGSNLMLRTRREGDYLIVNAQGGRKKLKSYMIEEKIPAGERGKVLLLAAGSEILWVTGHRISESAKVSPQTKRILEVRRMGESYGRENQCNDTGRRCEQKDRGDGEKDQ
ncbi:MAG: tRNA lysidine(34) synthetase TilS [Eubacteriales bacterium]|nr:tRNA lysidine(34) synthetase TilS [Eubacteriales bacterium]